MTNTAILANNNQQFIVQENETVLEAAIRSGVPLSYGCSSGTCGMCQAKLLSGKVEEIRAREFVIPEADKLQGNFLTCVCTLNENSVLDAIVAVGAKDIPLQNIEVKVRKIEEIAKDIHRIIIQTPRTKRLRFLAGQYIKLKLDDLGTSKFSIASCPCEDRLIELHLRIAEDDVVSKQIANHMRVGDTLELEGPFGEFAFDEQANRAIILFAFDTGFAAIKSLLEHITAQEEETSIHLIWMSCGQDGLYMNNLCRSWADAFDGFRYTGIALNQTIPELKDNPEKSCAMVETHLNEVMAMYDDLSGYDIYISAPSPRSKVI